MEQTLTRELGIPPVLQSHLWVVQKVSPTCKSLSRHILHATAFQLPRAHIGSVELVLSDLPCQMPAATRSTRTAGSISLGLKVPLQVKEQVLQLSGSSRVEWRRLEWKALLSRLQLFSAAVSLWDKLLLFFLN